MLHVSAWDFFPCTIDDRHASIFVDLDFRRVGPPVGHDTHFIARVAMLDLGPHGMGTESESTVLSAWEDEVETALAAHDIVYVGRIRTAGVWQMSFYGPARAREHFVVSAPERVTTIEVQYDPGWHFYEHTLLPSLERQQWMSDRAVVEQLEQRGDPLTPRQVDHWAYFDTADARDAFLAAAEGDGFARAEHGDGEKFVARVCRVDPVDLEGIHAAVMILVEYAVANGGDYDGWECPVEIEN